MEIVKEGDAMRKKFFAGAVLLLGSTLAIAGCNATSDMQAKFDQKEYILSIDDSQNFLDKLTLRGKPKSAVTFKSSSSEIVEKNDEGIFVAKSSGSAIIEAQIEGRTIASCKVVVKYKMASPKNFKFSGGILSWDRSFVIIDGEEVFADEYQISYKEITSTENVEIKTSGDNQFSFDKEGAFDVTVSAKMTDNSHAKYIDTRDAFGEYRVIYGQCDEVVELRVEQEEDYTKEKATLVWNKVKNSEYDIYLNGICIEENYRSENYLLDYSASSRTSVKEGEEIVVRIVAKDKDELSNDSSITKTVKRLEKPSLSYVNDDENKSSGRINLEKQNILDECVYVVLDKDGNKIRSSTTLSNCLEGYDYGVYKICAYTNGGYNSLNSAPTQIISFAKLPAVTFSVDIDKNQANIAFERTEYVQRYKIVIDGHETIVTLADSENSYSLDLSQYNLSKGDYIIKVSALPSIEEGGVKAISVSGSGVTTSCILNSDETQRTIKVLGGFENMVHRVESGVNQFIFDKIEGATDYAININGNAYSDFSVNNTGDRTIISIPNLKNIEPNGSNSYSLEFKAMRKEGGKTTGIESSIAKTLQILGVVSKSTTQNNGSFAFNKVSASDTYYYEIYNVDKDGKLDVGASPIYSRTIYSGNSTIEDLEGGYYKIRIYTRASDPNNYLDSNFYNSNGYFEADFSVEEQIATPTITYNKETNTLNIEKVKFGGGYEIYVDDNKDGLLESIDAEDLVYAFSSETFKNAKTYSIKVKAVGGTKYGNEVYKDSSFATLTITKLATPTFEITEEFDEFGIKTGERLDVDNSVANVDKVEYYIGNTKLDEEGYSISFYRPSLGNNFEFKVKYIARGGGLDNYYLDSEENVRTFERIDFPTNLQYKNGNITFTGSSKAEDYYLMVHFVKDDGTELYRKGFELDSKNTSINLKSVLEKQIAIYPNLSSIIENSDKLKVELYAIINQPRTASESYLLYSYNGKTADGVQTLEIDKLPASTLSFNKTSQTLSWTEEKSGSTYDIYANGEVVLTGLTSLSTTLVNKNLATLNYLNGITLKIKTNNIECLESKFSNEIYIKKLSPASEISISQSNNGTIFLSDPTNTLKVLNNGQELNYTLGDVSITKTFTESETLKIIFVGRDEDNRYYLDSDEAIFDLIEFSKPIIVKEENILSWNDFSNYLNKVSENTIIYTLTIESGSNKYDYITTNPSIDISDIQTAIGAILQKGEIFVSVKASLGSEYSVQNGGSGCYGKNTSEKIMIEKLDIVEGESEVVYGSSGNEFNKKINSKIKVTFADKWTKYDEVKFKIKRYTLYLGEYVEDSNEDVLGVDEKTAYMSLSKVDGQYVLLIDNSYFADAGQYKLKFVVMSKGYIESDVSDVEILRFENISALSVTDSGEVTLSDENNFNGLTAGANGLHLIMLSIGKDSEVREVTKNIPFQISDYSIWENNFGQYTLQAICYDGDGKVIPSDEIFTVSGTKIEGISSFSVNDDGNIVVTLSDSVDIKFKGEINGTIIDDIPFVATTELNQFTISILDIMELFALTKEDTYTFNLTVRKDGSVDADWESVQFLVGTQDSFEVVKDGDNINTYLVIEYDEKTTNFRFDVGEAVVILSKDNDLIKKGYIYYDSDKDRKTFSLNQIEGSSLYYAVAIDDFLNRKLSIEYGDLAFSVSRVSKENKIIKQHNETLVPLSKLNMIETEELKIYNSVLYFAFENKTEANELIGIQYLINFLADEDGLSFQKIISTTSLDLRNIGLTEGITYTISVRVICSGQGGVSSQNAGSLQTIKYTTPIGVEISKGRLVFNIEEFKRGDFAEAIISFAKGEKSEDDLLDVLDDKIFKSPYYFSTNGKNVEIADGQCQLKFVKTNNGAITGEIDYSSITSMKNLIPDFEIVGCTLDGVSTFFEVIDYLYRSTAVKTEQVSSIFKELMSANRGIGLDKILFDDIGREISMGKYNVQVCQIAGSSGNVDSDYSSIAKNLNVNPAPMIDLEYDDESNQYFANITPQGDVTNYILQIRNFSEGVYVYPAIYISLRDGEYITRCNDMKVDLLREYSNGFSINLSKIKTELEKKSITVLTTETTLTCDIFADDENSLSKSAVFDLTYRELDSDNITFADGYIQINNSSGKSFLIRYKHPQSNTIKEKTFYTNKISLAGCDTGEITYLVLSCPGQISMNSVYIESKRFLIKDIYQLSSLTVKGTKNEFNIKLSNNDLKFLNQVSLKISNNISEKTDCYIVDNLKDYYSVENLNNLDKLENIGINYRAGKVNGDLKANRFNFDLVGNSLKKFGQSDYADSDVADYQLTHDGVLIFSSGRIQAQAKMLDAVELSLNEGNIEWEALSTGVQTRTELVDSETTARYEYNDGVVIYEVTIDYFSTSDSDTDTTPKTSQLIYTTSTSLSTDILMDTNGEINYSKYTVTVTALVGEESLEGEIETIEGKKYSISKYACYTDTKNIAVLRSAEASKTLSRSEMATDVKVKAGKIEFKTSTTGFTITATRDDKTIMLDGDHTRGNDNKIVFTPNVGEDNNGLEEGYEYTLRIYTYGESSLLSKPVTLESVIYKLPEITKERYEIKLEFDSTNSKYVTMLDLSKLFEVRVAGETNFKVCISYTTTNNSSPTEKELTSDNCKVAIDGWKTIEMYVTANESATQNLINSSVVKLNIEKTITDNLNVEFDNSSRKFKWAWSEAQSDNYVYFVELEYDGGTKEKKMLDTNANYYIPVEMKVVSKFSICARKLDIAGYEYTFSDFKSLNGRFDVKLFDGGKGTEDSPYIISTVAQFTNIQFRNEKGTHFKLENNLTINQSDLIKNEAFLFDSFNGVLNGNGKTITFTCDKLVATNIALKTPNEVSVNKGFALFKQIATDAKVLDLKIDVSINSILTTTSEKAIISPIALINEGTIEYVILNSMTMSENASLQGVFYISGIAGINQGKIIYCGVENFDIKVNDGSSVYFGGIAVSQSSGSMDLCYNNGDIGTSETIIAQDGILLYSMGGDVTNTPSTRMDSNYFKGQLPTSEAYEKTIRSDINKRFYIIIKFAGAQKRAIASFKEN